ncbi:FMN-binding negative transcriptional regulator [Marivirga lumbricoides]|uniref:FMN-binding negative transcriptional regulator n=1 Tax=Marivirga lumbricoides TaxID=1046115 RepID=A0A2T4DUW8_9BACT|nr:FMN-binding negative transcriptional regulator [Marivirga lumbricoides]
MFQSEKYKKSDRDFTFNFIKTHPFATFVTSEKDLIATHIPVLLKEDAEEFTLYGHIANQNEQLKDLKNGVKALLIFKGPDSYVSSSWYQEKNISTWDYTALHINCSLKVQTSDELVESLKRLVYHFEKDRHDPLLYHELPKEMLEDHLKRITGFWLYPERIQGIAKLHQGFKKEDIYNITKELEKEKNYQASEISKQLKEIHGTDH